jgi:hypothetical protein
MVRYNMSLNPKLKSGREVAMPKYVLFITLLLVAGPAFGQAAAKAPQAAAGASAESRMNDRIAQMHKRLKITPAQDAFAQVMRSNAAATEQAYRQRATSVETMSAPENLRNFAQIEQARAEGMRNLSTSFDTVYGSLSDEQKKTADAMFRHYEVRAEGRRHQPKKAE